MLPLANGFEDPATHPQTQLVIVIDDEQAFCDVVSEIITSSGYRVKQAYHAEEALGLLTGERPDLILLDVMMPGTDGISLIQRLRSNPRYATVPIIVSSAKCSQEDQSVALEAGADDYLTKPFSAQKLIEVIRRYLPSTTVETV